MSRVTLALLLAGTAVGLGLVEVGLRIHYALTRPARLEDLAEERALPPRGAEVRLGDMIQPSPYARLVYELRPGLDVRFMGARVRTSSRGWRGPEHRPEKPPGVIRILALGDSVAFGWGVEEGERYSDRLEALLNGRHPQRGWQVLNLACPGYNLVMELEALERYGLDYDPDLILYGYVANDVCLPNFVADDADVFGLRPFLWSRLADLPPGAPRLVARDEAVGDAAETADFSTRFCTPESVPERYRALVGAERFERALERLAAIGRERGIPVVLVAHPIRSGFEAPAFPPGIRVVRASGIGTPRLRLSQRDPHPNAAGHAVIARDVFQALEADGTWDALAGSGR